MSERPAPLPSPERSPTVMDRLRLFAERPLGRLTTALAAVAMIAAGEQRTGEVNRFNSAMHATVEINGTQTELRFADWNETRGFEQHPETPYIQPNAALEAIVSTNEPLTNELALTPPNIEKPDEFSEWIHAQATRKDLLEAAGITDNTPSPRELVNLAAAVVVANIDYEYQKAAQATTIYAQPVDRNLQENNKLQCEGFASATIAVFEQLKKVYPAVLKNTYMVTQRGVEMAHVWDMVVQVHSPSEASVSFIDPAADDPNFLEEVDLTFLELLEGLNKKGILDPEAFEELTNQYRRSKQLSPPILEKIERDNGFNIGNKWINN